MILFDTRIVYPFYVNKSWISLFITDAALNTIKKHAYATLELKQLKHDLYYLHIVSLNTYGVHTQEHKDECVGELNGHHWRYPSAS